jgi:acyl transferase domain-containing protein
VAGSGGRVWVAAVNSPASVVLAGDREALAQVLDRAEAGGVRTRWLPVSYASHGPAVDVVAGRLARDLAGVSPVQGRVPLWSAVTGEAADGAGLDGAYWVSNLREQVRFEPVIRGLAGSGHGVFIEVSPHPVLVTAIEQTLEEAGQPDAVAAGTLRRDDGGPGRLLASAAEVFTRGVDVDWAGVFAGRGARRVDLPTYAFQRERYWPRPVPGGAGDARGAGLTAAGHPLLAAAVSLAAAGGRGGLAGRSHGVRDGAGAGHGAAGNGGVGGYGGGLPAGAGADPGGSAGAASRRRSAGPAAGQRPSAGLDPGGELVLPPRYRAGRR